MRPDGIAGLGDAAFDGDGRVIDAGGEWQSGVDGDVSDAGQRADRGQQAVHEGAAGSVILVVFPRQGDLSGEQVIRTEADRGFEQVLQAEAEKARTRQQHEGNRDLHDDEAVAQPLRRAIARAPARLGLQTSRQLGVQIEPDDRRSEDQTDDDGGDQRHGGEAAVERNGGAQRQLVGSERTEQGDAERADEQAEEAAAEG